MPTLVSKGKLKAKMLGYLRRVERTGEPLVVTDRGRAVLEIRPIHRDSTTEEVLEEYRSGPGKPKLPSVDELMEPLPWQEWEAFREEDQNP